MPKARSVQISLCEQLLSQLQTQSGLRRGLWRPDFCCAGNAFGLVCGPDLGPDSRLDSTVFWPRLWDRNPVPKSGPPNRIYTRRSRFQDRNPVPKSGPQTSRTSIPCVAKIWPRGPDFGTGFLSPNRDPKVVHKVDQDVYFPTSSGCLEDVLFVGILTSPECSGCVLAY